MRILHTVDRYLPDVGGGATEVVRQVSKRLAAMGHDVTIATSYSASRGWTEHEGVRVAQFRIGCVLDQAVLGIRGEVPAFVDFLRNGRFDVVLNYAAQTWPTNLTFRMLGKLTSRAVLAACGYSGLIGLRRLLYWNYYRRLPTYLKRYDAVVYHSANYQDKWFGDKYRIKQYAVIPNGIDSVEFEKRGVDFRSLYNIRTPHLLLTVGDHFKNKGHVRVLAAFKGLSRGDVTLVIIGRNVARRCRSCWTSCRAAAKLYPGRVLLLDGAPRDHVVAAYQAADIFLFGSFIEAFPLVILEAMGSRLPFVAFPAGNIAELAGGVVVNSTGEMAGRTEWLLASQDERRRLGEEGHAAQRSRYDWDKIVPQYESLYRRLLAT